MISGDGLVICWLEEKFIRQLTIVYPFSLSFLITTRMRCAIFGSKLYLGHSSCDNRFMPCSIGAGLAAMYPDLPSFDVFSKTEFESLWEHVDSYLVKGPMVISLNLSNDGLPPFEPFLQQQKRLELAINPGVPKC